MVVTLHGPQYEWILTKTATIPHSPVFAGFGNHYFSFRNVVPLKSSGIISWTKVKRTTLPTHLPLPFSVLSAHFIYLLFLGQKWLFYLAAMCFICSKLFKYLHSTLGYNDFKQVSPAVHGCKSLWIIKKNRERPVWYVYCIFARPPPPSCCFVNYRF
jgi:hypothetical protein